MKQFDIKSTKTINGNKFFIRPLPAYKCANLSGELAAMIAPILTSVVPLVGGNDSVLDIDAENIAPALAKGASELSGDKVESMLKKLLSTYNNVSVELEGDVETKILDDDLVNEVFCGEVQDMFVLAFEVIKVNFSGFTKKLGTLFGDGLNGLLEKTRTSANTES